jgi:hypothetical protein
MNPQISLMKVILQFILRTAVNHGSVLGSCGKATARRDNNDSTLSFIGKIRMRLSASGGRAAVKRRAVEPVNKVKILPVYTYFKYYE